MSFRLKTILGIGLIEIVLLSILVFSGMQYLQSSNEKQLQDRAHTTVRLFATMAADAVVSLDLATLDELVKKTMDNPGLVYLRVRHKEGVVLAEAGPTTILSRTFEADQTIEESMKDQVYDVRYPVTIAGEEFGQVELGVDTQTLEILLKQAGRRMYSVAFLEIVLVGVFGFLLGGMLTRQLSSLQKGARVVSEGMLGHTIKVRGNDELADTARSFNEMSRSLAKFAEELEHARAHADARRLRAETVLGEAIECLSQGVLIANSRNEIVHINKAFLDIYSLSEREIESIFTAKELCDLIQSRGFEPLVCNMSLAKAEMPLSTLPDGRTVMHSFREMTTGGKVWVDTDISQILLAEEKNRKLERDLLNSQKMESIGTLAGGIAHEINTPVQYIGDNLRFIGEASQDLIETLDAHIALVLEVKEKEITLDHLEACISSLERADYDFLKEELPSAVEQSSEGVKQVSNIVLAMKEFSHPTSKTKTPVDLNRVIERSAQVCRNEWKAIAKLEYDLETELPTVEALEGDLNQVMLNLIVNAAHAIENAGKSYGEIKITTFSTPDHVVLQIADNGTGVSEEIKERIFEPFFTTKEIGKGTGQGLAITYDIITNKHDGMITVHNLEQGGAMFEITLKR